MSDQIPLNFSDDGRRLSVGLSWDHNEEESAYGDIKVHDLDLSCAVISQTGEIIDIISPQEPKREQYKFVIFHSGDHASGASDFEDELINVQINNIDDTIGTLAFFISTKDSVKLKDVANPECVFLEGTTLDKFFSIDLAKADEIAEENGQQGAYFLAGAIQRAQNDNTQWVLKPVQSYLSNTNLAMLAQEMSELLK